MKTKSYFLRNLIKRSYFPEINSVDQELKKIGILRILLGVIILVRFLQVVLSHHFFFEFFSLVGVITLLFIVSFTVGFFTPLTTLLLIIAVRVFDSKMGTNTLGTTILVQVLLVFLLTNSGQYYSIDNLVLKRKKILYKLLARIYSIIGVHNINSLRNVYFFGFLLYALVSFGAVGYHFLDEDWNHALTLKKLLGNSYLSTIYLKFRWFDSNYPLVTSYLSIIATFFQSTFQIFMVPLIFNKWGSQFVKWWGLQFFVISLFCINLSYLPHLEIIFWGLIFFPMKGIKNEELILKESSDKNMINKKFIHGVYKFYGFITVLFIMCCFPFIKDVTVRVLKTNKLSEFVKRQVYDFGLETPIVFNKVDLSLGDFWMVIYRKTKGGDWELVPISGLDGNRLQYNGIDILQFSNHNSDFLYFGTTLNYRKNILKVKDYESFHIEGHGYNSIVKRISYDYNRLELTGDILYRVEVYKSSSSNIRHWVSNHIQYEKKIIYKKNYIFKNGLLKIY